MRPLKTKDIFTMSKILNKMKLKLDVKNKTQEQLGAEFVLSISENLYKAEKEVNEFISELNNMTAAEFAELDITEAYKIFNEFRENEEVKAFLSKVGQ